LPGPVNFRRGKRQESRVTQMKEEPVVYIGIGSVVLIAVIVLIVLLLRR
jgi:hypothetical protein